MQPLLARRIARFHKPRLTTARNTYLILAVTSTKSHIMKLLSLIVVACAALFILPTPQVLAKAKDETSETQTKKKKVKKLTESLSFSQEKVHAACLEALAKIGCEIKEDTGATIKGKRPLKVGALVGSGGEILNITLLSKGDVSTEITVETKKTMVGMAGQKLWTEEVMSEMKAILQNA